MSELKPDRDDTQGIGHNKGPALDDTRKRPRMWRIYGGIAMLFELTRKETALLACLVNYSEKIDGRIGEAWPSQETLADDIEVHRQNVGPMLSRLRELGYVTWRRTQGRNQYTVNIELIEERFTEWERRRAERRCLRHQTSDVCRSRPYKEQRSGTDRTTH